METDESSTGVPENDTQDTDVSDDEVNSRPTSENDETDSEDELPEIDDNADDMDAQNVPLDEGFLYPGASITRRQSEALILSFATRYRLPEIALRDLLLLINTHTPNVVHQSKYHFLKDLDLEKNVRYHYFCEVCEDIILFFDNAVGRCTNESCSVFNVDKQKAYLHKNGSFFLHKPLASQLKSLLNNQDIYQKLSQNPENGDVTSGSVYRNLVGSNQIGPRDITLQWNTDGASAAKSSKCSIWPIQVAVNELPYQERKKNVMLASLWQGAKPKMNTFLRPFVDELQELHVNGIVLANGVNVKVHCLIATVDSVARPLLQNLKQFNGSNGCSFCLNPGERIARGAGSSRVYCGEVVALRDDVQHLADAREATESGVCIRGVNGPSLLMLVPMFNIITSFTPDYLHAVLLGTVRWFLTNWLDSKNSDQAWYLGSGHKFKTLSDRLLNIKPPSEVTRCPRSFDDLKLFKASEFRSFLLYYSIPCLKGLLPTRYIKHWLLLVVGITLLLKENVAACDVETAKYVLTRFVLETQQIYSIEWMTFNLHVLLHLPSSVETLGPLWSSSTFMYEHFNGVLLNLFSGTQYISSQIFKNYERVKQINTVIDSARLENWHPMAGSLLKNLAGKYFTLNAVKLGSLVVFGAPHRKQLNIIEQLAVENLLGIELESSHFSVYNRFLINGIKINTKCYDRMIRRTNYTVFFRDGSFFNVYFLVDLGNDRYEDRYIALGKSLTIIDDDILSNGVIKASSIIKLCDDPELCEGMEAVRPQAIVGKCVEMKVGDKTYVCPLVNSYERD